MVICEIADKYFNKYLTGICEQLNIELKILPNPMFFNPKLLFSDFVKSKNGKRLVMNNFYIQQCRRLNILIENEKPVGDKCSFGEENRKNFLKIFKFHKG